MERGRKRWTIHYNFLKSLGYLLGKSDTKALPVANVLSINVSLLFPAGQSLHAKESGSNGLEEASILFQRLTCPRELSELFTILFYFS